MKLTKASAWIHNKANKDVNLSDLNIKIRKGDTVDLFKVKPTLTYESYLRSKTKGVLYARHRELLELEGPPLPNFTPKPHYKISKEPIKTKARSAIGLGVEEKDFIDILEEDFPENAQPLSQEEAWRKERAKVLETLDAQEQGVDGEVFSDTLFDTDKLDEGFDY